MSISYSNEQDNNIKFDDTPVISVNNFTLDSDRSLYFPDNIVGQNCDYLKLMCGVTCNNTNKSTEDKPALCVVYYVNYEDSEGNISTISYSFYPKYKHENDNQSDFTIISTPGYIRNINIYVYNNDTLTVAVSDFKVYYAEHVEVTGETVAKAINDYTNNGGTFNLVIPLVTSLPPIGSVPDGYICRLASLN